jgi:uncharacterized delta-60 repeat protein
MDQRILVARLLANGDPDPSFGGGDGRVTTRFVHGDCFDCTEANAVRLQSDGRIVVLGFEEEDASHFTTVVARFLPDGRLDRSFGPSRRGFLRHANSFAIGLAIQHDDKIVVAGFSGKPEHGRYTVLRYRRDGRPDPSFGDGGKLVERFGDASEATSALVQPDGRVVVAGQSATYGAEAPFSLVLQRFEP